MKDATTESLPRTGIEDIGGGRRSGRRETNRDRGFDAGMLTGSLNVLLRLSYVVMFSLYAFAFCSYGARFLPHAWQATGTHVLISVSVILIAGLNLLNVGLIGKAGDSVA